MTRIAITADLHADDLGQRIDPETGLNARFLDGLAVTSWVAREARERGCNALIVAGDFAENRHPSPWRVAKIGDALREGPDVQIYVRGNHDAEIAGGSIVSVLADGRNRIGISRPEIVRVAASARDAVGICAIPYLDRHFLRTQPGMEHVPDAEVFRVLAEQYLTIARGLYAEAKTAGFEHTLLIGHQTLAGASMSETQQAFLGDLSLVVDARALAAIGYSAAVFGHIHRPQEIVQGNGTPVLYAGSPQRVDFGEEHEDKSFLILEIVPGRPITFERIPTPARRFVTLTGGCGYEPDVVREAIVRCIDVDPELDAANLRSMLEADGAFEVIEIRRRPVEAPEIAGVLSETLTPADALAAYFDGDSERDELCELGRELLAEAAA